jgi:hypothetical protein
MPVKIALNPQLIGRQPLQHQPPQAIYITEVKRLSPNGQRENLQPLAARGGYPQKTQVMVFQAIKQS